MKTESSTYLYNERKEDAHNCLTSVTSSAASMSKRATCSFSQVYHNLIIEKSFLKGYVRTRYNSAVGYALCKKEFIH